MGLRDTLRDQWLGSAEDPEKRARDAKGLRSQLLLLGVFLLAFVAGLVCRYLGAPAKELEAPAFGGTCAFAASASFCWARLQPVGERPPRELLVSLLLALPHGLVFAFVSGLALLFAFERTPLAALVPAFNELRAQLPGVHPIPGSKSLVRRSLRTRLTGRPCGTSGPNGGRFSRSGRWSHRKLMIRNGTSRR